MYNRRHAKHLALFELLTSHGFQVLHQEYLYKNIDCKYFLQSSILPHIQRIKMLLRAAIFCTQYRSRILERSISEHNLESSQT
jgi:hypothetical protein